MPDTYTTSLRVIDQTNGENATTWGDKQDLNNLLLETAIAGRTTVSVAGAGDTTLTALNGAADQARNDVIELNGVVTGSANVIVPTAPKRWIVYNNTTGAFTRTVKTAAGSGVLVPQGKTMMLRCDGTNVVPAFDTLQGLDVLAVLTARGAIETSLSVSVVAAATTNVWQTDGNTIHITGAGGPITSLGTAPRAGSRRTCVVDSTPTLTHGANLILPTAAPIICTAGDTFDVFAETTTQLRVTDYQRADGSPLTIPATITGPKTFTTTSLVAGPIVGQVVEAGAAVGFGIDLDRQSATPAANDYGAAARWTFRDTLAALVYPAYIVTKALNLTAGAIAGQIEFWTKLANVDTLRGFIGQGWVVGNPTGGDLGQGLLNVETAIRIGTLDVIPSSYAAKIATYTIVFADRGGTIIWTTAACLANLPAANTFTGRKVTLINQAASGDVTITPAAGTLDGIATRKLKPGDGVTIMSDGTNWFTIRGRYSFNTGEIATTVSTPTANAHGFGLASITRLKWRLVLRNKTAELGYSIGDEITLAGEYNDKGTTQAGAELVLDTTNVTLLTSSILMKVLNKGSPTTAVAITGANWRYEALVWDEYFG